MCRRKRQIPARRKPARDSRELSGQPSLQVILRYSPGTLPDEIPQELSGSRLRRLFSAVSDLLAETSREDLHVDEAMRLVCNRAQSVTGASGAVIEISEGEFMVYRASCGSLAAHEGMKIRREGSLSGQTLSSGVLQVCRDSELDARVNREASRRVGARSMALVPLVTGDAVVGILKVVAPTPDAFDLDQVNSLQLLAGVLAFCIQRAHDTQVRLEAERELAESEAWFRTLIEGAPDMIGVLTLEGVYTYCSPSVTEHLGYAPGDLVGRNAFDIIHHDDVERVQRELALTLATPPHRASLQMRVRSFPGNWREVDVRLRMVTNAKGTPLLVVNSRDITTAHQLQRRVADSERLVALGRVASSMAHEFNNVLMGVQPHAELVARLSDSPAVHRSSERMLTALARGKNITQQILRLTRDEPPNRRQVSVSDVLRSVESEIEMVLPAGIHLTVESAEAELMVMAEATQVEQTLVNLCLNARDAMPAGGRIRVCASAVPDAERPPSLRSGEQGFVCITVSDTGPGISSELMSRIFEPLFTTKKGLGGNGLGLPIARQIAEAHQGGLFVDSAPGAGATFSLFLPRARTASVPMDRGGERLTTAIRRLLLVEDDDLVAEGLIAALESMDIETKRVATGGAATAAVIEFTPEVVVVDYGLPDMRGTDVFRTLRARWPQLPIVFATGHADGAVVREEIGATDVEICSKPFSLPELLEAASRARQ